MVEPGSQGLAIYGAIVGSIALCIHIFNFIHTKQKDSVRLSVSCAEDDQARSNLGLLQSTQNNKEWDRPSIVSLYKVVVRNIGNTEAFIQAVGIVDKVGDTHHALVSTSDSMILAQISQAKEISIKAKASQTFKIYIKRDESLFTPKSCFVTDQQGKTWKSKLKLKSLI